MKTLLANIMAAASLLLGATVHAQQPEARIVAIANPARSIGVQVGDVLKRSMELELKQPYQLSKSAWPAKGTSRDGMELVDASVTSEAHGELVRYHLVLSYQVFAHAKTPTVMQLPAETFPLTGGPKPLTLKLPAWRFWFSPLVDAGIATAKASLQPQRKPPMVDIVTHQQRLAGFIGLLAAALLGLLYVNADRRWLPFMGGAFAQAYRQLKHVPMTPDGEKKALLTLHQAFNRVHGSNLFAADIDRFLAARPGYARMRAGIEAFFERSNLSLFAERPQDSAAFISELILLSKGLRDCERGLR